MHNAMIVNLLKEYIGISLHNKVKGKNVNLFSAMAYRKHSTYKRNSTALITLNVCIKHCSNYCELW